MDLRVDFNIKFEKFAAKVLIWNFCKCCKGGDGQMNALIWYSWLGGIIIGTMIGSNMVLEEVSRSGPRNVVITGRYFSRGDMK